MSCRLAITAVALVGLATISPTLAQSSTLYFSQPDGSLGVIVPGGPGYVNTPFPSGDGYTEPRPNYGTPPYGLSHLRRKM